MKIREALHWLMRLTKRKPRTPRITLRHIHAHLLELHEAVMQVLENQNSLSRKVERIMASQAQLAQDLRDITAQNEKARLEILAQIKVLEDALSAAGGTTPEVDQAVADLKASVQKDDDQNPDAPTP
jgi:heme oxygenase